MVSSTGISLLYKGYSWRTGWDCTLYQATYSNGTGKELNMHKAVYDDIKKNVENFGVDCTLMGPNLVDYIQFFDNDDKLRWCIRHATGKNLSSQGRYDKYTAILGVNEIYRYYHDVVPTNNLLEDPEISKYQPVGPDQPDIYPPLGTPIVGCLIGVDGKFYTDKASAEANGTTPVALVCALNGSKRVEKGAAWNGLAMALDVVQATWGKDFYEMMDSPCGLDYVSTIAEMSGMLNGIAATDHLVAGCGKNHAHNAAKECRNWSTKLNDAVMATGNFSDWFLPSSGQWVLAYKGFGYPWNDQGYDMSSQVSKAENIFKEAGIQIPDISDSYWSSTPYDKEGALNFGFDRCFLINNTVPLAITVITKSPCIPFMAFKYNGGATED